MVCSNSSLFHCASTPFLGNHANSVQNMLFLRLDMCVPWQQFPRNTLERQVKSLSSCAVLPRKCLRGSSGHRNFTSSISGGGRQCHHLLISCFSYLGLYHGHQMIEEDLPLTSFVTPGAASVVHICLMWANAHLHPKYLMIPRQHFARPGLCCIDNATGNLSGGTLFNIFFASAITTYRCFDINYLIAIPLHIDTNLATMVRGN